MLMEEQMILAKVSPVLVAEPKADGLLGGGGFDGQLVGHRITRPWVGGWRGRAERSRPVGLWGRSRGLARRRAAMSIGGRWGLARASARGGRKAPRRGGPCGAVGQAVELGRVRPKRAGALAGCVWVDAAWVSAKRGALWRGVGVERNGWEARAGRLRSKTPSGFRDV